MDSSDFELPLSKTILLQKVTFLHVVSLAFSGKRNSEEVPEKRNRKTQSLSVLEENGGEKSIIAVDGTFWKGR